MRMSCPHHIAQLVSLYCLPSPFCRIDPGYIHCQNRVYLSIVFEPPQDKERLLARADDLREEIRHKTSEAMRSTEQVTEAASADQVCVHALGYLVSCHAVPSARLCVMKDMLMSHYIVGVFVAANLVGKPATSAQGGRSSGDGAVQTCRKCLQRHAAARGR